MTNTGHSLDLIDIRAYDFAAIDRTFFVHCPKHSRNRKVNAEYGASGEDGQIVDAGCWLADDPVVFRILHFYGLRIRWRQRSGFCSEGAIGESAARRTVCNDARCGR